MPLVRIDLLEGKSEEYREQLAEVVYRTLVDVLAVPEGDKFQVITEHKPVGLQFSPDYLGIHKTEDNIFVQITLNTGRDATLKQIFYRTLADRLHTVLRLRREDLFVSLVEVSKENWSFGNGEAQYVPTSAQ